MYQRTHDAFFMKLEGAHLGEHVPMKKLKLVARKLDTKATFDEYGRIWDRWILLTAERSFGVFILHCIGDECRAM